MYEKNLLKLGPTTLLVENSKLYPPEEFADRIENLELTKDSTLRTIRGPTPLLEVSAHSYGNMQGIGYFVDFRGKMHLLIHDGAAIKSFRGDKNSWDEIFGASGELEHIVPNDSSTKSPTRFVTVPGGIIIIPHSGRALFYDGTIPDTLGYVNGPSAPVGFGPHSNISTSDMDSGNDEGYLMDSANMSDSGGDTTDFFGFGQLGTVIRDPDTEYASLLRGSWQAAYRWIDYWGNLSPLSQRSEAVLTGSKRQAVAHSSSTNKPAETLQFNLLWTNIQQGEGTTVGGIFCRTKDQFNSGSSALYEYPSSSLSNAAYNIPGSIAEKIPDSVPDTELVLEPLDVIPVPLFRVAEVAFGQLWVAGMETNPSIVRRSIPGKWGTFLRNEFEAVAPAGNKIVALKKCNQGLLVFTDTTTALISQNNDTGGFYVVQLSASIGAVGQESVCEFGSTAIIWLSRRGFAAWDGQAVTIISTNIEARTDRINWGRAIQACAVYNPVRGEYLCSVPYESSTENNRVFVFDGTGFREYTDLKIQHAVHINGMIVYSGKDTDASSTERSGVWVFGGESAEYSSQSRSVVMETPWMAVMGGGRFSIKEVLLTMRETTSFADDHTFGVISCEVYRDFSKRSPVATITFQTRSKERIPPAFDSANIGADQDAFFMRRRAFQQRKSVSAPSTEVIKLRFTCSNKVDIKSVGMTFHPRNELGRRPRG